MANENSKKNPNNQVEEFQLGSLEFFSDEIKFEKNEKSDDLDDSSYVSALECQVRQMLDSIMRIGSDVSRMRIEIDILNEERMYLNDSFEQLKRVIEEKGCLDLDEFNLACDVLQEFASTQRSADSEKKKFSH